MVCFDDRFKSSILQTFYSSHRYRHQQLHSDYGRHVGGRLPRRKCKRSLAIQYTPKAPSTCQLWRITRWFGPLTPAATTACFRRPPSLPGSSCAHFSAIEASTNSNDITYHTRKKVDQLILERGCRGQQTKQPQQTNHSN
ncbi:hypothetical protein FGO68_gene15552 [Halteria grandinella]|uniref:Uncharacterized protein n=1 Tax=Halteria grandinella TaxID=5974 RepID=A0A8J8SUS9_HALGN|nr:hypothetical protein FGO68_gene15552 [Halteria grandinella]